MPNCSSRKYGMDKYKFRQFLEEVAEIKDMNDYGPNGCGRGDYKKQYQTRIEIDEFGEEIEITEEVPKLDPYIGIKIKSIKPVMRPCHLGCGAVVPDQVIEQRLAFTPYKHYRTRCGTCNKYVSPINGEMVDSKEIGREFYRLNRDKNK